MIKTATSLLVLIGLICLLQLFLPWYGVALAGMLVTLLLQQRSALAAFLLGLVGGALVWGSYSG
ncbi:MAG: adenosine deaminase, partial [Bacteroidetes bacterium]